MKQGTKKKDVEAVELPANLADIFSAAEAALEGGKLTEWEAAFLKDNLARREKWGDGLYLSAKQLTTLRELAEKAAEVVGEGAAA